MEIDRPSQVIPQQQDRAVLEKELDEKYERVLQLEVLDMG